MGISSAKAVIYSLVAGVDPRRTLSVVLDVGTNNKDLLDDELYLGWPHERVRGDKYDEIVDRFMTLTRRELGEGTLIHFASHSTCRPTGLTACRRTLA